MLKIFVTDVIAKNIYETGRQLFFLIVAEVAFHIRYNLGKKHQG